MLVGKLKQIGSNIQSSLKYKKQQSKERDLQKQARYRIGVVEFEGQLFISYDGTPLYKVDNDVKAQDVVTILKTFRDTYVKGRKFDTRIRR